MTKNLSNGGFASFRVAIMDDSDISVDRNSVEDLSVLKKCGEPGESDV